LEEFLKLYQTDEEAWHELACLHLDGCEYSKACYCYEELILHDPNNWMFMLKYAECLYSLGEKKHMLEARKYYAQSICLHDSVRNLRSYYGLWICCIMLATQYNMKDNAENKDLLKWVVSKLRGLYTTHCSEGQAAKPLLMLKMNQLSE